MEMTKNTAVFQSFTAKCSPWMILSLFGLIFEYEAGKRTGCCFSYPWMRQLPDAALFIFSVHRLEDMVA
jgi:hypothetical protein